MSAFKRILFSRKSLAGANAFFLLYFLAASAPHRVHHSLEQVPSPSSEDAGHTHDHTPPQSKQSDCAIQSATQHAHLSSVELVEMPFLEFTVGRNHAGPIIARSFFNPSPCSQRAPPAV
jgi:hypothetical protein